MTCRSCSAAETACVRPGWRQQAGTGVAVDGPLAMPPVWNAPGHGWLADAVPGPALRPGATAPDAAPQNVGSAAWTKTAVQLSVAGIAHVECSRRQ